MMAKMQLASKTSTKETNTAQIEPAVTLVSSIRSKAEREDNLLTLNVFESDSYETLRERRLKEVRSVVWAFLTFRMQAKKVPRIGYFRLLLIKELLLTLALVNVESYIQPVLHRRRHITKSPFSPMSVSRLLCVVRICHLLSDCYKSVEK